MNKYTNIEHASGAGTRAHAPSGRRSVIRSTF
ncbi:BnaC02g48320D [Brassica napus]|uniref:BnaC02g48320D protein n=1 Tax=Brassica napus TaxID=3708 RepID=A0A078IRA9_BRANA|nr:BnaC02g48320D [Brassica napus]